MDQKIANDLLVTFIINSHNINDINDSNIFDLFVSFNNAFYHFIDYHDPNSKLQFDEFVMQLCSHYPTLSQQKDFILQKFQSCTNFSHHCPIAGIILFNSSKEKVLVLTSAKHYMSFPKGKLKEGYSILDSAISECIEEISYDVSDIVYKNYNWEEKTKIKYCYFFPAVLKEDEKDLVFEPLYRGEPNN